MADLGSIRSLAISALKLFPLRSNQSRMLDLSPSKKPVSGARQSHGNGAGAGPIAVPDRQKPLYRHYKGGLYQVEGSCTVEASGEVGVLYRALDPSARQDLWMRPLSDFESVLESGARRFAPIARANSQAFYDAFPADLVPTAILEDILARYDAPGRYFHNSGHLFQQFALAKECGIALSREQAVALLFHDVAYLAGAPEGLNERISVQVFQEMAPRLGVLDADKVSRIIMETASHMATCPESAEVQGLDLSSLAGAALDFCVSNELVWLENRHLLDAKDRRKDFDTRRLTFLLKLAEAGPLFTAPALSHLEAAALENLEGLRQAWVAQYQPSASE